ncbi:GntR family transcriptional regulator [Intrasporangium oryzae NRRL B-24470]|uniref:GntR family transcriptional regulator n=1 Tax=Intrasporangium oryzae NRRL B-24470 TaxID=1386089 RepID=W9G7Q5_9MICO|nr:PLP-dependent aminotransferase family protein [Intrasporangium oryzae]EWT00853.1 GntR family transcriptional regulator [Intrasporangium oryzae NRRL B-24470]
MRAIISALEERLDSPTAKGLAQAVSRAIRDGSLAPGDRLPPIRRVAEELMVSPTTVSAAWQLLSRSGTIRSDGRRGTTIAPIGRAGGERYNRALRHQSEVTLDLSTGIPDATLLPDLGPVLAGFTGSPTPGSYLDDPVLDELRTLMLEQWPYAVDDVLVVDGAMDALDLITRNHLRPGDLVVVETPGFPPMLDLLEDRGVEVVGVPLDETGVSLEHVQDVLERRPAAIFIQPRGHNPTGISMSPTRARRLAGLVRGQPCFVVEDDSGGDIAASAPISLGAWIPDQVIHVRSFSKSHGPDLRLAAVSGPSELLSPVRHARALGQGWSSRLLQRALAGLLTDPRARAQVERARAEYARRRGLVVARLTEQGIAVPGTDGLNIWVPVRDEAAAVLRLASQGIAVTPGAPFAVGGVPSPEGHIRVTTGLIRTDHVEIADRIAEAARTGSWTAQHR